MADVDENAGKIQFLNTGSSFRMRTREGTTKIIKTNQRFEAYDNEVPQAFRDIIKPVGGVIDSDTLSASGAQFKKIPIPWDDLTEEQQANIKELSEEYVSENAENAEAKAKSEADAKAKEEARLKREAEKQAKAEAAEKERKRVEAQEKADAEAEALKKEQEEQAARENLNVGSTGATPPEGAAAGDQTGAEDGGDPVVGNGTHVKKISDKGGGWWNIVNVATGKQINEKALREKDANETLTALNS